MLEVEIKAEQKVCGIHNHLFMDSLQFLTQIFGHFMMKYFPAKGINQLVKKQVKHHI